MIKPSIRTLTASDGYCLSYRHWGVEHPKGIVMALHGIQSHSGWYEYSSQRIAEAGFAVYFGDRRGSGQNGFQRGHAPHAMRLINDVRLLAQLARSENAVSPNQKLPITLMGISWGGKIASATAALFPQEFQNLALLYPGLESKIRLSLWQRFRLNLARDFEITKKHIPIPLEDPKLFTDVAQWQDFIRNDALALHTVTSSFLNAGRDLDRLVARHAPQIQIPTLLMLAQRDMIIDNAKVRQRVNTFGSSETTTYVYKGAYHTLEFDSNREAVVSDLVSWLISHS